MSNAEIDFIMDAIELTALHFPEWMKDYTYNPVSNEYAFKGFETKEHSMIEGWFKIFPHAGGEDSEDLNFASASLQHSLPYQ